MFTGIVEERGRVAAVRMGPRGTRLEVEGRTAATDAEPGASISVNGACLTVVGREDGALSFDVAPETLSRTTLGSMSVGDPVNLERPVTLLARLGGHLVQGHVDGVGDVESVERTDAGRTMTIRLPSGLEPYVVEKGSVAVDGVSLTVATSEGGAFSVALVPHTLEATTLGERKAGDRVNIEVDVLAKYVEGLLGRSR